MRYTKHAQERMGERGISKSNVIGTILAGEEERTDTERRYAFDGLVVVTDTTGSAVITVYHDNNGHHRKEKTKARKSRKTVRKRVRSLPPELKRGRVLSDYAPWLAMHYQRQMM